MRLRPLMALASLVALVAATAAPFQATTSAADSAPVPTEAATPVFSARRVPGLLLTRARTRSLESALDAVVAQGPTDVCVTVAAQGRTVFSHRADQPVAPASNQKLVTAQLALETLGHNHRYRTLVAGSAGAKGVIQGNLFLVGGGDPVLETQAYRDHFKSGPRQGTSLEKLADDVVSAGVRHITGSVLGDESRYDSQRAVAAWPGRYLDQHQLGPLTALEVNQSFTSFPEVFDEENLSELQPAADPPSFAASTFAALLRQRGVDIDGSAGSGRRPANTPTVATITSPPLSSIVAQMLNRSDNQIAELLVKEAGREKGTAGTTAAGLAVFRRTLARLGLPTDGVVMHDGSGLDRDDRLSCGLLLDLLERAGADSAIASGLAVAGKTGTLRKRFTEPDVKGKIRAKTGTLTDVTALSGFADSRHGPTLVFTYIANGEVISPELLEDQDRLAGDLVGFAGPLRLSSLEPR